MPSLEFVLQQQAECAEYLAGDGDDKEGAWRGLCDWLMEECLMRKEEQQ